MKKNGLLIFVLLYLTSCSSNSEVQSADKIDAAYSAGLTELSDEEYPDNPDISVRHPKYIETTMDSIEFLQSDVGFTLVITPENEGDDTVKLNGIRLMEFIPTIPECSKGDEYMSLISVVNQEWNRNQVKWVGDELKKATSKVHTVNNEKITRIDLARNCLNSYLWELFFYADVDGKDKVFYHAWFNFPAELYKTLFDKRNADDFENYTNYLETWRDPENLPLELSRIRVQQSEVMVPCSNRSDEMYPLKGERKKKQIAIIYPETYTKMSDFHTDSALFATFSQPGFYNRKDPRTTELGRFKTLNNVQYRLTETEHVQHDELRFEFSRENGEVTQFIFGGIQFEDLPTLATENANSGSQFSMGIGNHPFYEDCIAHEKLCSKNNPYFGVLLDGDNNWLDSHKIGIDGPLLHRDLKNENLIHVWLLSFERHALVGHYIVDLSKVNR
ncbi:MAG: hypothetical protein P8N52_06310 [Crocinitomicaceae bacterium]|nr:hypothetical protein [Crocinitomicaceae bacterium]MDG1777700.1 hypothetical protein [Crocinitomicaceae bacterium]